MKSEPFLDPLIRDLRYGGRMLRKAPGFTLAVAITLAVGIGANTAVFSAVYALLLEPLPYRAPERLALVVTHVRSPRGAGEQRAVDGSTYLGIRDNATTVDVAASGSSFGMGANLVAGPHAANVRQGRVTAGYFQVLGVVPLVGREFDADEDRLGGQPVAILSQSLWSRVFDAAPDIVGRTIQLRGEAHTVVGVMPSEPDGEGGTEVWTPLRPATTGEGGGTNYRMIARLRPGVGWEQANAELAQLGSIVRTGQFPEGTTITFGAMPLQQADTSEIRQPLLMLWAAVGLVLLIACVNVAGLLLARAGTRMHEIATRMALGSGRRAVIRQLLAESAVLALVGGVLGVGIGWIALETLKNLGGAVIPNAASIGLNLPVLASMLLAALLTSVVFGVVPAVHASRVDVNQVLGGGTRTVAGGSGHLARRALVLLEVAIGVVLLVSAGLLARTFVELRSLEPGFDPAGVVTATVSLQDARYREPERVNQLFAATLSRLRELPEVEAAGVALGLPYTRLLNLGFRPLDGGSTLDPGSTGITNLIYATPGFFGALRQPVRRGRPFDERDSAAGLPVAIVNEEFVSQYYKGQEVIGRRIATAGQEREIVGVVANARATSSGFLGYTGPLVAPPIVYVPAAQTTGGFLALVHTWFSPSWVVRTDASLPVAADGIRRAVAEVDPLLPVARLERLEDVQAAALATERFMMSLMVGLSGIALLLAAVGIHALVASVVTERRRELGIRLALGATATEAMRSVVVPGVMLAAAGVLLGSAAALAAARLLESFLWGVTPTDPATFLAVILTLLGVAVVASVVPALRVLRLDPAVTLRAE